MTRIFEKPASHLRHLQQSLKNKSSSTDVPWWRQILDPNSNIVNRWNYVFLLTCLISLFIDPLYFYVPFVSERACMSTDDEAAREITIYRSLTDIFYFLHIAMKFRTAFVAPSSRVFGRGELVMDPREIAIRYLKTDFIVDFTAALPLPQIVIRYVIPAAKRNGSGHSKSTLALIVLIQYVPRLFVIFPLNQQIIKTTGFIAKTAWAGAAYNLLLFMLASHVAGASWYVASIGRQFSCWAIECNKERDAVPPCILEFLDCSNVDEDSYIRDYWRNSTKVLDKCDAVNDEDSGFKFGIFADAFTNEVASSSFMAKYLYCLWWGLRNLSSYGQNLNTSTYIGETLFSIFISIIGLVLFAQLIGNMQTYLQSMTVKIEEWRIRKRDIEEWMRHRQLPEDLQERVRRFDQCKWLATRGVNEEEILQTLPLDLRRQIQRHLCLNLVRRVPFFEQMDDQLLDAICERLVSTLSIMGTYVVLEDDPVNEMLFIIRGQLESSTTNGGRSGFFNSITLGPNDFCGEELLTWALLPNSTQLPASTRTVRTLSEVEAFALRAEDLKFFAVQFKRLHSMKLQHAFRYYSHQWRTWGACFIQAAWRRYMKKKMEYELALQESYYYNQDPNDEGNYNEQSFDDAGPEQPLVDSGSRGSQQLGATILAKRFAANTRRGIELKMADSSSSLKMPKLFKPDEPDFSAE
ncbi:cyclic nucleotide-gated ion channel 18 isoform X1 [Solanum verrucosum]|uniref:cyclic nucleotide-gated ion channel 18 isoform X1 n=1 Tax=Solanum verrucosum TaxID=315347 RepID=UPI0020D11053|nr:cyclic nucleotide-gated ion channel 18 isoform X1 [Solanum verrucosum]